VRLRRKSTAYHLLMWRQYSPAFAHSQCSYGQDVIPPFTIVRRMTDPAMRQSKLMRTLNSKLAMTGMTCLPGNTFGRSGRVQRRGRWHLRPRGGSRHSDYQSAKGLDADVLWGVRTFSQAVLDGVRIGCRPRSVPAWTQTSIAGLLPRVSQHHRDEVRRPLLFEFQE